MSNIYKGKLLPRGWFVYTTDEGKPYFHNRLTASTQWEVPSDTSHTLGDSMSTLNEVDTLMNHGGTEGEIAFLEQTAIESTTYRDQMLHLSDDPSMQTGGIASTQGKAGYTSFIPTQNVPQTVLSGHMDVEASRLSSPAEEPSSSSFLSWLCIDLRSARLFFDVNTPTVMTRLSSAVIPHKLLKAYREPQDDTLYMHPTAADNLPGSNSPSSIRQSPDLYGPFWIPTTLIFILFVATNASKFLAEQSYVANYSSLIVSATAVYGYLTVVPLAVWILLWTVAGSREKSGISLLQLASVYGYSFATGIPLAALSIIPSLTLRWIIALVGSVMSFLFIMLHFRQDLRESTPQLKLCVLSAFVLSQLSFYATFPLYYFSR